MEKRIHIRSVDELGLVKAAAWARYQQGSGPEGRHILEFDLLRTKKSPKPSRYKLEAMEKIDKSTTISSHKSYVSTSNDDVNNSLLDTYEIESISRQLQYYIEIESSRAKYYGGDSGDWIVAPAAAAPSGKTEMKSKQKKMKASRWRNAVMGSSRYGVVQMEKKSFDHPRRLPEKHVPVVELVNCRPWRFHA
ncbi:Uncharacterized protein Adt_24577 [Abeliophyllum distichum]|uniref:Uncharacterized protein n=1 Tax=Abeliophyllum distichum TaxID=126358 RepID=A0ABD1SH77_9LAMI